MTVTRVAPSPSGFLHLGNAVNFLLTQRVAEPPGSRIHLRIDDLGLPVRPDHLADIFWAVEWLGLTITDGPRDAEEFDVRHRQGSRIDRYRRMADRLGDGWAYVCRCSRTEVARRPDGEPDPCSAQRLTLRPGITALRLRVDSGPALSPATRDAMARLGVSRSRIAATMGDFVVWRRDDLPAYQLVSVVDDDAAGIDTIVRGADLLDSSAAQLMLADALGLESFAAIRLLHHSLVTDEFGHKLSKRDDAMALRAVAGRPGGRDELTAAVDAATRSLPGSGSPQ